MSRMYDPEAANAASPLRQASKAPKTAAAQKPREVVAPPPPRARRAGTPVKIMGAERVSPTVSLDPMNAGAQDSGSELRADIERIRASGRRPMAALRQKLALPEIPGYWIHWFNDTAGRVAQAEAAGFTHILNEQTKQPISLVVGVGRDGKPLLAYAMKIPMVFHEEDMAARHAEAKAKVDAIKENPFRARAGEATRADAGKFYTPETSDAPLNVVKG